MTDQDPPIGPLRRLDPSEPDDQDLGRLERLDPDAEETAVDASADTVGRPPSGTASRLRSGLTAAITLAALLSLSSIAAIGGLVAISMSTVSPTDLDAELPVDMSAPVTTIRVGESARGLPEKPDRERPEPALQADDAVVEFTPVAPTPANEGGRNEGGADDRGGRGSGGGERGAGGAWCDARQGGACDAVVGGVLQPTSEPDGDGYVASDDDETEDEDIDEGDDSTGSSHPPGKGH